MKSNELGYEEYPDDFEDVKSDDEIDDLYEDNDPAYRLTQKSGQKELSEVMDEYQKYITKPKEYELHNSSHFSELPSRLIVTDQPSEKRRTSRAPQQEVSALKTEP